MRALVALSRNLFVREYNGYLALLLYAVGRIGRMTVFPYSIAFLRQLNDSFVQGIGVLTFRALSLGVIIVYVLTILTSDSSMTMQIFAIAIFREGGALLAAAILLLKVGTENTNRLNVLWGNGEARYLHNLGLSPYDYLVVPRILAVIVASVVLTLYFQLLAAIGAMIGAPILVDTTFDQLFGQFAVQFKLADIGYTMIKSMTFGAIIGVVTCYHGTHSREGGGRDVRSPMSRALLRAFFLVTLFNALFAYIFYGVLLFGVIRSTV